MNDKLIVLSKPGPCINFNTEDKKNILFPFGKKSKNIFDHIKISKYK